MRTNGISYLIVLWVLTAGEPKPANGITAVLAWLVSHNLKHLPRQADSPALLCAASDTLCGILRTSLCPSVTCPVTAPRRPAAGAPARSPQVCSQTLPTFAHISCTVEGHMQWPLFSHVKQLQPMQPCYVTSCGTPTHTAQVLIVGSILYAEDDGVSEFAQCAPVWRLL